MMGSALGVVHHLRLLKKANRERLEVGFRL
jgi:hypothetical protein